VRLRKFVVAFIFLLAVLAALVDRASAAVTVGLLIAAATWIFVYLAAVYALEIARASDARMARIEALLERIAQKVSPVPAEADTHDAARERATTARQS
jgi:threonine/homoserine/homoserine lactone efflux protein